MHRLLMMIALLWVATATDAQNSDTCEARLATRIEESAANCTLIDMQTVCYASGDVTLQPRADGDAAFARSGDSVSAAQVNRLTLNTPESLVKGALRTNLLDGSVTMIAYGPFEMLNLSSADADYRPRSLTITYRQGAILRAAPTTESRNIEVAVPGETLPAVGRSTDSLWLQTIPKDPNTPVAWVLAELTRTDFEISELPISSPDAPAPYDPYAAMQALGWELLESGADASCGAVPAGGALILQTPNLLNPASITVQGLEITFSGTLWITALIGDAGSLSGFSVSVLEGEATLNDTLTIPTSRAASVAISETGRADLLPPTTTEYRYIDAINAPLILLPREVELAFTLAGIVEAFEPGTGFLTSIPADGPCTIAWTADVNLRTGPGTLYPIKQGVPANFSARPVARATGTDGQVWWKITDEVWLLANNTFFGGACGLLPFVEPPPFEN